jgi:hypothetical protein
MTYQSIVLMIATIFLIIVLVMFGITFRNNKKAKKYPPVQSECPDYWTVKRDKDGKSICENVQRLGDSKCQTEMDFSLSPYTGSLGKCSKNKWATTCGITWDGITNADGIGLC